MYNATTDNVLLQIFTRMLNSFNLPMGPPEFQVKLSGKDGWNGEKSATLVVALLVNYYNIDLTL